MPKPSKCRTHETKETCKAPCKWANDTCNPPTRAGPSYAVRRPNVWLMHVNKVREQNPGMAYKDILKLAAQTYKKTTTTTPPSRTRTPSPRQWAVTTPHGAKVAQGRQRAAVGRQQVSQRQAVQRAFRQTSPVAPQVRQRGRTPY